MDNITIRNANQEDAPAWNQFILNVPNNPCYLFYEWQFLIENEYDAKTLMLVAEDAQKNIKGILFTYHLNQPLSPLYTPEFGIFSESNEILSSLVSTANQYCVDNNLRSFLYTTGRSELLLSDRDKLSCKQWEKSSFILDLEAGKHSLWSNLSSSARNKIRKAEKSGVKVVRGFEYFDAFYSLYSTCYSKKRLNVRSKAFLRNFVESLKPYLELLVCFYNGTLVAGAFFLKNGSMCSYLYNSSDPTYRNLGVNDFLVWHAAQYYIDQGLIGMNLGESTPGSGAYDFKAKQLKCPPRNVHYYLFNNNGQEQGYHFLRFSNKVRERVIISLCKKNYIPLHFRKKLLRKRALFGRFV